MSLSTNVSDLATRIATEIKSVRTLVNGNTADLSSLNTTAKTNLVSAINEVYAALSTAGVEINDTVTANDTVWSSSKTQSEIDDAIAALVDGAPAALDTLNELAAALGDDSSFATTVMTAIGLKANDADVVKLSGNQTIGGVKNFSSSPLVPDSSFGIVKITGLQTALDGKASTTSVGDTTVNYVITFEAGLV